MDGKSAWGGSRKGAGRLPSHGEPTRTVRLPASLAPHVAKIIPFARALRAGILNLPATQPPARGAPLFGSKVAAGFPSAADDYIEARLDLNEYLVGHKEATFFLRVKGDSMTGANIHDGNLLIVDRSIVPKHGDIVVATVNGEFTVKRLYKQRGVIKLLAANEAYPEIVIKSEMDLVIFGAVKHVVQSF